jgi:hypothetical protein
MSKTAYQYDHAGLLQGFTEADESPLEPGVYLLPARCTLVPPPDATEDTWPRWNGSAWQLVTRPAPATSTESDPVAKLRDFLNANPDVAALLQSGAGAVNEQNP